MDRETLIAYSFLYGGEYGRVFKAVKNAENIKGKEIGNAITILDDAYPRSFLDLKYPPFVFYYKGNLGLLKESCIAIVGSRNPCVYALKATEALSKHLHEDVVVSGMAKGIDACAHAHAEKTIGILGCGIDYIYPACNKDLFRRVEDRGLLISEYPGLVRPLAYHFPFRNRLIAALSERVYIMQSAKRSGTMTTVNEALELGKEVRVLPYSIFDEQGRHNNQLIYEGAQPILFEEIAI